MAQLERVRDALHQQPFRSFEIRLLDGRSFLVKHPDFVALPPTRRKRDIVLYDEAGVHVIDLCSSRSSRWLSSPKMAGDVRGSDWRPLNCRQVTASIPHESSASIGPVR